VALDFATTAEEQSFGTEDFRSILAGLTTADLPQIIARPG
jgi:hypothetical protein